MKSLISFRIMCFAFLMVMLPKGASEPSADSLTAQVDKLFSEWDKTNSPGCGIAISRNGTLLYARGYGMANLELGVPITPASVFPAASISKQFTAMSILLLVERGQLSLDDPVWKFIPEWADREHIITIRHLLTHSSGLREAFTLLGLAAPRETPTTINDSIVKILARQRGLNFTPGSEFQYNNGAYNLLATIVKRVSGQSLREYADASIFKPLGMSRTHFQDDPGMLVADRVSGYTFGKGHLRLARLEGGIVGNSGLFTTSQDLLLWEQNFAKPHVGSPALLAEMQHPAIPVGDGSSYGFGLFIGEHRGLRTIGHGGGDQGISTYVARFPDQELAIAVLGNFDGINTISLSHEIADIYLANFLSKPSATTPPTASAPISLSSESLASKAGLYRDLTTQIVGRFFVRDGKLRASVDDTEENSFDMVPLDANRFTLPGTSVIVEFISSPNGKTHQARVTGDGSKPKVSQQLPPFTISRKELRAFAGKYVSLEIETTFTVTARDSDLLLRGPEGSEIVLKPVFQDAFLGFGGTIQFTCNKRGASAGFTLHRDDVRGLHFDRVKD